MLRGMKRNGHFPYWHYFQKPQRATNWRPKFLCPSCRKCFKRHIDGDPETRPCPNCGGTAVRIGVDFRPPKLTDDRAWRVIEVLIDAGVEFRRFGGYIPTTMREARMLAKSRKAWGYVRPRRRARYY